MHWDTEAWGAPADYDIIESLDEVNEFKRGASVFMTADDDEQMVYDGDEGIIVGFARHGGLYQAVVFFDSLVEPVTLHMDQFDLI